MLLTPFAENIWPFEHLPMQVLLVVVIPISRRCSKWTKAQYKFFSAIGCIASCQAKLQLTYSAHLGSRLGSAEIFRHLTSSSALDYAIPIHPQAWGSRKSYVCVFLKIGNPKMGWFPLDCLQPNQGPRVLSNLNWYDDVLHPYCGWTKSISQHLKPWLKPFFVGIHRRISRSQGF